VTPQDAPFGDASQSSTSEEHMPRLPTVLLATGLAISPIATSTFHIATNGANAFATMKSTLLMPGKTKTFPSAGEYGVCNEGDAPVVAHVLIAGE
jgi:hypothetical protein